ncbi:MAG: hypothetical protein AAF429_14855 [Pseudomonadota bacterium]
MLEFLNHIFEIEQQKVRVYERVLYRIQDCGLNTLEVVEGIKNGRPVTWEVTPERWQFRVEIKPPHGDAASYSVVVYIDKSHRPFCEDLR